MAAVAALLLVPSFVGTPCPASAEEGIAESADEPKPIRTRQARASSLTTWEWMKCDDLIAYHLPAPLRAWTNNAPRWLGPISRTHMCESSVPGREAER